MYTVVCSPMGNHAIAGRAAARGNRCTGSGSGPASGLGAKHGIDHERSELYLAHVQGRNTVQADATDLLPRQPKTHVSGNSKPHTFGHVFGTVLTASGRVARPSRRVPSEVSSHPGPQQIVVFAHAVAVAGDVDDVAVVCNRPADERSGDDLVGERAVVHPPAGLRDGGGEADREVGLATPARAGSRSRRGRGSRARAGSRSARA